MRPGPGLHRLRDNRGHGAHHPPRHPASPRPAASSRHGHPRYTGNIGYWVSTAPADVTALMRALHAFGFGSLELKTADFAEPQTVIQLGRPTRRIDLFTAIHE